MLWHIGHTSFVKRGPCAADLAPRKFWRGAPYDPRAIQLCTWRTRRHVAHLSGKVAI